MHTWVIVTLIIIAILVIKICIAQLITHLANPNRKTLPELLAEAKQGAQIEELVGTWKIDDSRMPIKQLTVPAESIGIAKDNEKHYLGCNACNSTPVGSVEVSPSNMIFRDTAFARTVKRCVEGLDYVYKLVLHPNGVVRFVLHPNLSPNCTLVAIRADSKSLYGAMLNIIHRFRYGCFCLGILSKDGNTIQRYNRWADKYPDEYYTMKKVLTV